jgi:hypothetical protein
MSKLLIINTDQVQKLLTIKECIEALRQGFQSIGNGTTILPLRNVMWLPEKKGALGLMPTCIF